MVIVCDTLEACLCKASPCTPVTSIGASPYRQIYKNTDNAQDNDENGSPCGLIPVKRWVDRAFVQLVVQAILSLVYPNKKDIVHNTPEQIQNGIYRVRACVFQVEWILIDAKLDEKKHRIHSVLEQGVIL